MNTGTGRVDESVFAGAPVCGYYRAVAIVRWRGRTTAFPSVKKAAMAMSRSQVASFNVACTRILRADGSIDGDLPDWARDRGELVRLYRAMLLARTFDAKAIALQRTGRLGTYASSLGQEAVAVGVAAALQQQDVLAPSYRELGAMLWRGITPLNLLSYWGGDERGNAWAESPEDFPICVPVGSNAPHAAGIAMAFKLRREPRVAACVFGDGATSKGDVYEAMNLAGVWHLPVLFVINNNGWAISVPQVRQSAAETLAQKAIACGFAGEQVDGNDVIAVREVVAQAAARSRAGDGPSLIEALTYRLGDHTTADDASRYRDDIEVGRRWKEEPIARLRHHLVASHAWGKCEEEEVLATCALQVDAAVEAYLALPQQPPESMFEHLFATLASTLQAERDALLADTAARERSRCQN
jgi:2-oxoisovalerate dehydrogenase E1 component alpha subunit